MFFLVFASARENPVFPPKKCIFVYFFCVSLCFSLALFHFLLFLCLSLFFLLVSFLSAFFISVSGSSFFFCFVYFRCSLVSVVLLVVLLCFESYSFSCFCFASFVFLLFLFFVLLALVFFVFFDLGKPNKNIFKKTEIEKTAKMKNAEKKDT